MNLDIVENVFYYGRIHHVRALSLHNYQFKNNLMIGAIDIKDFTNSKDNEMVSCYASWE